ncbi:MAG: DMT family transporter [Actinomycetota bacterium]
MAARDAMVDSPTRKVLERSAIAALLGAMTIWGSTYVVTKVALADFGPFSVLWTRLVIATLALAPFAWRRGFRARMWLQRNFLLFGFTGMALHLGLEIAGLRFTSASSAALIIATAPTVTVAFSVVFLKERISWLQAWAIVLSVVGVVLVAGARVSDGHPLAWFGNLLVFAGVVAWGVFTVQGRQIGREHSWLISTTAATGAATLLVLPVMLGEIAVQGIPPVTAPSLVAVASLGLLASALAYGWWNFALEHVGGTVAGPYISLVPAIGVSLAVAVGETMTRMQLLGGAIVAAGVWLNHRGRAAKRL